MSIAAQAKDDDTFDSAHVLDPAATRDSQGQISEEIAVAHAQAPVSYTHLRAHGT